MKKLFTAILAVSLVLSSAACGKTDKESSLTSTDKNSADYQTEHFAEDADKNADSSKIDGIQAKPVENSDASNDSEEGSSKKSSEKILVNDKFEVSIDNVVVAKHEDRTAAIVDFTFKNKSSDDATFTSVIDAQAYQGDTELPPAIFQTALDGFEPNTIAQQVKKGQSITVQKAYALKDETTPLEIAILSFADPTQTLGSKTFAVTQ